MNKKNNKQCKKHLDRSIETLVWLWFRGDFTRRQQKRIARTADMILEITKLIDHEKQTP